MRAELTKEFRFEAAHMLPNHGGKCRELHGHSYRVQVHVTGPVQSATGQPDEGMVVDFDVLKQLWREFLHPLLDHRYLNDSLGAGYQPTTAENIARFIHDVFTVELEHGAGLLVAGVTVWETATGSVRFPA